MSLMIVNSYSFAPVEVSFDLDTWTSHNGASHFEDNDTTITNNASPPFGFFSQDTLRPNTGLRYLEIDCVVTTPGDHTVGWYFSTGNDIGFVNISAVSGTSFTTFDDQNINEFFDPFENGSRTIGILVNFATREWWASFNGLWLNCIDQNTITLVANRGDAAILTYPIASQGGGLITYVTSAANPGSGRFTLVADHAAQTYFPTGIGAVGWAE